MRRVSASGRHPLFLLRSADDGAIPLRTGSRSLFVRGGILSGLVEGNLELVDFVVEGQAMVRRQAVFADRGARSAVGRPMLRAQPYIG